jgi:hypothetical protein
MTTWQKFAVLLATILTLALTTGAQTWQTVTNPAPFNAGAMVLLTDGTVMVHSEPNCLTCTGTDYSSWYKLTPDASGSYVNGTWTKVASLPAGYAPLYFSSAVLPDGRLLVEGGEYNNGASAWTNLGAIYDPLKDTWTAVAPPAGWTTIGDAQSVVLSNGTYMQANCCTTQGALFNPTNLTWTPASMTGKFDINDEEGWTLLPSGKILTVDAYVRKYDPAGTQSEIYNPATGVWSNAGSTINQLWDSAALCGGAATNGSDPPATYELGPAVLRPDGSVFATGSNVCGPGHTAIYDSHTGTWSAGPDFLGVYDSADGPAALETNGNVLVMTSPSTFYPPAPTFYEWNGSTLTIIPGPLSAAGDASFVGHFLELPSGQIMYTDFSTDVEVFTPAGTYNPAWAPSILSVPGSVQRGRTYTVSGTQFNGVSQGAAYGDDFQNATNYPLVRIVNQATGHVVYARTHNHSTMGVATGSKKVSTQFDVPKNAETGVSALFVVANGIPSSPYWINVK